MIVRSTIGGQRIRVRLSNEFGTTPLVIGAVHVALTEEGAMIVPESDHPLTFGGESSVTIPSGAPILSDPTDLLVPAFAEIAVSIFLPDKTPASTIHMLAQHDTYISGPGDFTAKPDIPNATSKASWYWLADVEVWAADQTAAIVTLGDSITDGAGVKPGQYVDWPDRLARRIADDRKAPLMAVINEGIGGNRILHDGAGVSALARFDRDVLSRPGVASLIVLEGINDIGWPNMKPPASQGASQFSVNSFASETVTAKDLILGLQQIINRAHEHGIRVFGATMTPYEKADYFTAEGETIRLAVNQWIRTSGAFDGVLDFDAAVRDPNYTSRFREDYHSGDHPHPNAAGYKAMADAINLLALLGNHK
jgi:lysophospholipase L1-like esterase